ncbi:MAG: hypothetical protein HY046_08580 [Acidobacteria bacterium]|nr:hypothetical protein [Acidobacteriota bacterium]
MNDFDPRIIINLLKMEIQVIEHGGYSPSVREPRKRRDRDRQRLGPGEDGREPERRGRHRVKQRQRTAKTEPVQNRRNE